jgi:hypothetical protein
MARTKLRGWPKSRFGNLGHPLNFQNSNSSQQTGPLRDSASPYLTRTVGSTDNPGRNK